MQAMKKSKKKPAAKSAPEKAKKTKQVKDEQNEKQPLLKTLIFGEEKPDLTELEAGSTTILDILSPTTVDTKSRDYIVVDGVFHTYLYVTGYGYTTTVGSCWLAPLVEAGEGVNMSFLVKRQSKEKILSKISQTTMVNRSRMRDVGDTRQDYEELDSAISSGLYLKDVMNRQGEDFYYMHTLIEVTAPDPETLEQRVTEVEKLCVSSSRWSVKAASPLVPAGLPIAASGISLPTGRICTASEPASSAGCWLLAPGDALWTATATILISPSERCAMRLSQTCAMNTTPAWRSTAS